MNATNVYAVPFEEDARDHKVWFLDHIFHETMFDMFKKVCSARQQFIGQHQRENGGMVQQRSEAKIERYCYKRSVQEIHAGSSTGCG